MALPYGYEAKQTKNGRFYYVNHANKSTTWKDPRPLPPGWDMKLDKTKNKPYFVDHIKKKTQWQDPRPPPKLPPPRKPLFSDESKVPVEYAYTAMIQGRDMLVSREGGSAQSKFVFCTSLSSSRGAKLYISDLKEKREDDNNCYDFSKFTNIYIGKRPHTRLPQRGHCFSIQLNKRYLDFEIERDYVDNYYAFCRVFSNMKNPNFKATIHRGNFSAPKKIVTSIPSVPKVSKREMQLEWYKDVLKMALLDRNISKKENELVESIKGKLDISQDQHSETLESFGWSLMEYHDVNEEQNPHHEIPTYTKKECCVCLDAEATYIILDCMHLCLCEECADLFQPGKQNCPSCRNVIKDVRQTYS